jgi:hypothetical protein
MQNIIRHPLLEVDERDMWFQQDGATSHTARTSMALLQGFFRERLTSQGLWPPRSPDLTPPDLFVWGHPNPYSTEEVKTNIEGAISNINHSTLHWVAHNMVK